MVSSETRTRSRRYTYISVLLTVLVVIYVGTLLDWTTTMETLAASNWLIMCAALVVYGFNYWLRTWRFKLLLDTPEVRFSTLMGITSLYGMFNYLLPAKSGELTYIMMVNRTLKLSLSQGTATLLTARFFDFGIIALFLPVVLTVFFDDLPRWLVTSSIVYCVIVVSAVVGLLFWLRRANAGTSYQADETSGQIKHRLLRAWCKLEEGLRIIDRRGQYGLLGLLSVAIWVCIYSNFYLIVLAIGFEPSFFEMIVVSIILVPLTLLPIQGMANLGTHEAGWVAAYAMFGYPVATALTIAVTTHIVLFVFVLVLGALGAALLKGYNPGDSLKPL